MIVNLLIFCFGAVVGSFLNVCISRIPERESIIYPPSHCPLCKKRLGFFELIPIISFLILRGKCRNCGGKINPRYFIVEILTAIGFLLIKIYGLAPVPSLEYLALLGIFSSFFVLFYIDLEKQMVPDSVIIACSIFIIIFQFLKQDLYFSFLGGFLGAGIFFIIRSLGNIIFKKESLGVGDIELAFILGLFLGVQKGILAYLLGFITAGLFAVLVLISGKKKWGEYIAFGPFLILGGLISFISGKEIIDLYIALFF
jgi:leader peptidase (prepilin peptidase)/N-methyltransferase